ncbi:IS110 family transposase [Terrimonas alba]|uniref:IS110 family transposase n=1 Tax=Terrimonas alba TaxID=3349636 RepID=UPI0035F2D3CF
MKQQTYVCGLDVHKDSIYAAIYNGKDRSDVHVFGTFTDQITQLIHWLEQNEVKQVALESTGIYWVPIWDMLEEKGFWLTLVNPWFIKQMPGRKSDVKDAQWIATLLYKDMLRKSFVPPKQIRVLRNYSRQYVKLQWNASRVLLELAKQLELCNIRLTSVFTKTDSLSIIRVIRLLINGCDDIQELLQCISPVIMKRKGHLVKAALQGHVRRDSRFILGLLMQQYDLLNLQLASVEAQMLKICDEHYHEELRLLQTIPGIKEQSAMQIISETGGDMQAFESSSKMVGWAGLRPGNDESAGKIKSTKITKGNRYLKRILIQTSWGASRTKGSAFKIKFEQLAKRISRKKALVAISRRQLAVIWNVLSKKEPYKVNYDLVATAQQIETQLKYHQRMVNHLKNLQ